MLIIKINKTSILKKLKQTTNHRYFEQMFKDFFSVIQVENLKTCFLFQA